MKVIATRSVKIFYARNGAGQVGMPLWRPFGKGLCKVRTDLSGNRTARVLLCLFENHLVALHGFIKKTRATPKEELQLARLRQKELEND